MNEAEKEKAKEVGARILLARKEAGGMTQRELADLLGVVERSMHAYESGEVLPYRHLPRLEQIFGRSVSWFLHGEEELVHETELKAIRRELEEMRVGLTELLRLVQSDRDGK